MNLHALRWVAVVVPAGLAAGVLAAMRWLAPGFTHSAWGFVVQVGAIFLGAYTFSTWVFHQLRAGEARSLKQAAQLRALNEAALSMTEELSLDAVLQKLADRARELVGARYCAVSVLPGQGPAAQFVTSGISAELHAQLGHPPLGRGLLGVVRDTGRPLRFAEISRHPASVGFPPHHPPMRSFLGVPVVWKGSVLGLLYLTEKRQGREFTREDEEIAVRLANQAAVAIENAHLYEQARQTLAAHKRLEAQRQRLAMLEERERIGMDLHDGAIQSLYAVGLGLETVKRALPAAAEAPRQGISQALEQLNAVIQGLRRYILGLRPRATASGKLREGLEDLARRLRESAGLAVTVEFPRGVEDSLPPGVEDQLLHIASEAASNVLRHAQATAVRIRIAREDGRVRFQMRDDGRGFDLDRASAASGFGLRNMQARARVLGGECVVSTAPGQGAEVLVSVPVEPGGAG